MGFDRIDSYVKSHWANLCVKETGCAHLGRTLCPSTPLEAFTTIIVEGPVLSGCGLCTEMDECGVCNHCACACRCSNAKKRRASQQEEQAGVDGEDPDGEAAARTAVRQMRQALYQQVPMIVDHCGIPIQSIKMLAKFVAIMAVGDQQEDDLPAVRDLSYVPPSPAMTEAASILWGVLPKALQRRLTPQSMAELLSRFSCNNFCVDEEGHCVGLFPAIAMCNHSCAPNCLTEVRPDGRMHLRTVKRVDPNTPLTISYVGGFGDSMHIPFFHRQLLLQQRWGITQCECDRCCMPIDDSRVFSCCECDEGYLYAARDDLCPGDEPTSSTSRPTASSATPTPKDKKDSPPQNDKKRKDSGTSSTTTTQRKGSTSNTTTTTGSRRPSNGPGSAPAQRGGGGGARRESNGSTTGKPPVAPVATPPPPAPAGKGGYLGNSPPSSADSDLRPNGGSGVLKPKTNTVSSVVPWQCVKCHSDLPPKLRTMWLEAEGKVYDLIRHVRHADDDSEPETLSPLLHTAHYLAAEVMTMQLSAQPSNPISVPKRNATGSATSSTTSGDASAHPTSFPCPIAPAAPVVAKDEPIPGQEDHSQYDEAVLRQLIETEQFMFNRPTLNTVSYHRQLARMYALNGDKHKSLEEHEQAYNALCKLKGEDSPDVQSVQRYLESYLITCGTNAGSDQLCGNWAHNRSSSKMVPNGNGGGKSKNGEAGDSDSDA